MGDERLRPTFLRLLLDHGRAPRRARALEGPTVRVSRNEARCGDAIRLDLVIEDDSIHAAGFEIEGCLISRASASMMLEALQGRSVDEAVRMKR